MSKGFIYCNIAKQEEEYYSKIKEEYESDIIIYNEKLDKETSNVNTGIGGASGNIIFFIIFLIIGIVFLNKKPDEIPKKKKGKKKSTESQNVSNPNKPIGIGLVILGILCLLSTGGMVYFIIHSMKSKNELKKPSNPVKYDYKRPCYSRKQNKMLGGKEDNDDEIDTSFLGGIALPGLPDAAQRALASSNSRTSNDDSRSGGSSGGNSIKLTDVSGLTVSGKTVNNNTNKGGTYDAYSADVQSGWDTTKDSSGDIVKSDGTRAGTTREKF